MKDTVMVFIFVLLVIFTACEAENSVKEELAADSIAEGAVIHAGEGTTVIISEGVTIIEAPEKPLSVNQILQNVVHKRHCRVGDTITLKATVSNGAEVLSRGLLFLETGNKDVEFMVYTDFLLPVLLCENYYKDGEMYMFTLYISAIQLFKEQRLPQWELLREDAPVFRVTAELILTEKLKKEIREAGCWFDR